MAVTPHDFSKLFQTPAVVLQTIAKGWRVTDELWLSTIDRFEPPLLRDSLMKLLRTRLDPAAERRGRKSATAATVEQLVASLESVERPDVPKEFLQQLIERLKSGRAYTLADSDRQYGKRWGKFDRDRIIVGLYDEIYDRLEDEPPAIELEVFGEMAVARGRAARSEKAIEILQGLLTERTDLWSPSQGTIAKIIAQAPNRKRRSKQ